MTELVPINSGLTPWTYDVERLVERWREGRSPQTLRAYTSDLQNFAAWMMATNVGSAIDALLRMGQGEANETVRAYRSSLVDKGIAPATINRRLSALRSLVSLGKEFGYVTFDLATKNVRSQAYRDTRGPERDMMMELLQYAKAQPHRAKAARDVAVFLLLGYGRALRRGEVVNLDLEHFDARGSRVSVLRKGKRERQSLSLDPLVTRKMKAWIALRGNDPGPLFLQVGRGGRVLYGRRLSGDGIHSRRWAKSSARLSARMGYGMRRSLLRSTRPMAMYAPPESSRGMPRSRYSCAMTTTARILAAMSPAKWFAALQSYLKMTRGERAAP
jgi:site-specific recombinase XerC